jgi:chaperonin cofactor prefoldin
MDDVWETLSQIKKELDSLEIQLAMNSESIESIEMELRFLQSELDYEIQQHPPML